MRPSLTQNLRCWLHTYHKLAEGSQGLGKNACDPQVFTSLAEQVQTLTFPNTPIFSAIKGIYIVVSRASPYTSYNQNNNRFYRIKLGKKRC